MAPVLVLSTYKSYSRPSGYSLHSVLNRRAFFEIFHLKRNVVFTQFTRRGLKLYHSATEEVNMSAPSKRKILGIGILKESSSQDPAYSPERVKQEVDQELARLREAGFESTLYFADSKDIEATMPAVKSLLRDSTWDGVSVGFGLRGAREYTALFEDIVNSVITETRGHVPKLMFTSSTTDIYDAAIRVLGARP